MITNADFYTELTARIDLYNVCYLAKYPVDWDCCGFANVAIEPGRKGKSLAKMLEALEIDFFKSSRYGKTVYMLDFPRLLSKMVGHQALTYKEDFCREIINYMRELEDFVGFEIYLYSSMD